jgi:hypothetical protein
MTAQPAATGRGRRSAARSATLALGSVGSPAALYLVHYPTAAFVVAASEASMAVVYSSVIFFAVLFGSQTVCDRAFRLLRWIRDKPEPAEPPGPTPQQGP